MLPTVIEFFLNRKLATRVDDWYNFHRNLSSHWVFILKHMSERVFVPDPPLPTSDHYVYYGLLKLISRHVPMTFALDCFPLGMPLSSVARILIFSKLAVRTWMPCSGRWAQVEGTIGKSGKRGACNTLCHIRITFRVWAAALCRYVFAICAV